ncbi:MAG TPA: HD domain-containing phosphohydrolase [Pyrinomonadaceae bacterium]|nr:HD domain-containing phosphohydrolase [Pyrinomonadaceae bacterium]
MSDGMLKILHAFTALADLGEEIADAGEFDEMVSSALHVVLGTIGIRRGAVAEYDRELNVLVLAASRGLASPVAAGLALAPGEEEALRLSEGRPGAVRRDERQGLEAARLDLRTSATLTGMGFEVIVPLAVRGDLVGAILLGEKASGVAYTAEEGELLRALGRHVGVGLHNHRLLREVERRANENLRVYDEMRSIYRDTVRAFAAAIDCKDKYTQGHSERVGKYSETIAREMGWGAEHVEGMAVAGYLHDIGKLVVDRDIINAPYRIDAKKSSELSRHPMSGYEILAPISHPYADIPLTARYHHERIDGRGYPEGLRGEQIPLCAKIVAVADSFDAMTTDRPYKRRRTFEDVVEDFRHNCGKQFAPEPLAALCRALHKELSGETRPRAMLRLLGRDYIDPTADAPRLARLIVELEAETHAVATNN